jgi:hypothetical protein
VWSMLRSHGGGDRYLALWIPFGQDEERLGREAMVNNRPLSLGRP